jgi:hypothetical protein
MKWLIEFFKNLFTTKIPSPIVPPPQKRLAKMLSPSDINNMLNSWYQSQVGVKEVGTNKGIEVEYYQMTVDNKAQGESWCMAYMQTGLLEVCKVLSTYSDLSHLNARQLYKEIPIYKSETCMSVFNKTDKKYIIDIPGDNRFNLSIIEHCWFIQQQTENPVFGHTGKALRLEDVNKLRFITNEGNTDGSGSREGDGVYNRVRFMQNDAKKKFRGFVNVTQAIFDMIQKQTRG